ncbi:FKBP-type peptidyl-prolyl cis-trans isomerase [Mongoliitalea daihaiensis]|uniref:FKBP-type peptidyl-prolyl cis-trans isomerase n=1 Tax=Mongoliitalea daihaiensis TaxID=2782006 RepID=UPI001F453744|nr:FKBP-type peptidyl-prolyl cis-trans isomerase [Mongoliitalea daihaiensis]UJP66185.1 FKBP-type peptidyl-prolyl cis-trans isomerase [Mongoliitalea daihaiensis]
MIRKSTFLGLAFLVIISFACETPNPFGPVYDVEGNLARDRALIDQYLETAPIDSLYRIHDANGVIIIVQKDGTGAFPVDRNLVYMNYTGMLLDGTVFDTNQQDVAIANNIFDENRTYRIFDFTIGQRDAIEGFSIAFRRMRSGTKAVIIIPSPWAYRDNENLERIPPNSILKFEVDFLGMD